jgi:plastocyanin
MWLSRSVVALALCLSAGGVAAQGKEHVVSQKNKSFSTGTLKVKAGDSVSFRNDDPFFHNVFSLSDAQSFDLGSYPQGQSRKATFTKPGKVDVECAIHPEMRMVIQVGK